MVALRPYALCCEAQNLQDRTSMSLFIDIDIHERETRILIEFVALVVFIEYGLSENIVSS